MVRLRAQYPTGGVSRRTLEFLKLVKMIWLMLSNTLPGIVLFFERSVSRAWQACKYENLNLIQNLLEK